MSILLLDSRVKNGLTRVSLFHGGTGVETGGAHMAHSHDHGVAHYPGCIDHDLCRCETRRYLRVLTISIGIFVFEVVGGYFSGSLALLADAGHVFIDVTAILVSVAVAELVRCNFRESKVRSYGFALNVALLAFIAIMIGYEAIERLKHPQEVVSWIMLSVATIGGLGNYLQHRLLHGSGNSSTSRVLSLHVLSDMLMSVGVVIAGIAIWITGKSWIDPAVSLVLAVWISLQIISLIRNPSGTHHHH